MSRDQPIIYHDYHSCPKCSAQNKVNVTASSPLGIEEAKTECAWCKHEDYWAYGHYQGGFTNCDKYYFEKGKKICVDYIEGE